MKLSEVVADASIDVSVLPVGTVGLVIIDNVPVRVVAVATPAVPEVSDGAMGPVLCVKPSDAVADISSLPVETAGLVVIDNVPVGVVAVAPPVVPEVSDGAMGPVLCVNLSDAVADISSLPVETVGLVVIDNVPVGVVAVAPPVVPEVSDGAMGPVL